MRNELPRPKWWSFSINKFDMKYKINVKIVDLYIKIYIPKIILCNKVILKFIFYFFQRGNNYIKNITL